MYIPESGQRAINRTHRGPVGVLGLGHSVESAIGDLSLRLSPRRARIPNVSPFNAHHRKPNLPTSMLLVANFGKADMRLPYDHSMGVDVVGDILSSRSPTSRTIVCETNDVPSPTDFSD